MLSVFYIICSSIPMFVCAFWAIVFSVNYRRLHLIKKILFWFMLTATSLYFGHFIVFNHIESLIPLTDTVYSLATLSVYPLFYLYILSLTDTIKKRHLLLLLPGALIAATIGVCYAGMSGGTLRSLILHILYDEGPLPSVSACRISMTAHLLMKYVILAEVLCILPAGFYKLSVFRKKVRKYYSNTRHRDMKGIRNLLRAFLVTSCLSILADMIGRTFFIDSIILLIAVLVPFSTMLFLIGYIGHIQTFTIDDLRIEEQKVNALACMDNISGQGIQEEIRLRREELKENLSHLMTEKKLFLNPDLKLSDVARILNSNRTYVYEALKCNDALSFTDYVNRFRIAYSISLLKQGNKTIEEIYY